MLLGVPGVLQSIPADIGERQVMRLSQGWHTETDNHSLKPRLTFENHIKYLCKSCFFHLKNIANLRPSLSLSDAEKLVHTFVEKERRNEALLG